MTNNETGNERKPDLEGIAFWRDNYYYFIDKPPETDEAGKILERWIAFDLHWAHVGPHPFKVGDRIILFNHEATPELPSSVEAVDPIEVVDIGPSEIREEDGDFSHFIAYRRLKGFRPVGLSLEPVLELSSQRLIRSTADFQHRKELSQEEWDQIVKAFKLRQEQAEPEKKPNKKTSLNQRRRTRRLLRPSQGDLTDSPLKHLRQLIGSLNDHKNGGLNSH